MTANLDSPERIYELRARIQAKAGLRSFYREAYQRYRGCIDRARTGGICLELGSGPGFAKDFLPDLVTSDVIAYPGLERVIDGMRMDLPDGSLRFVGLVNVFHHIPDVEKFLGELSRCLSVGGRCLIVDQYPGFISRHILRYFHHEPYHPESAEWRFSSRGPLSDANGALAWIAFIRDQDRFKRVFPRLRIVSRTPHSPLLYWLAGGLKDWALFPRWALPWVAALDRFLLRLSPDWASFMDVEIERAA